MESNGSLYWPSFSGFVSSGQSANTTILSFVFGLGGSPWTNAPDFFASFSTGLDNWVEQMV
jgi:hypothetical protein